MAEVRSVALWSHGLEGAVHRLLRVLDRAGAEVLSVKPSRVDLCVDALIPAKIWNADLRLHAVTRSRKRHVHEQVDVLEGLRFGDGDLLVRIYDKDREIKTKSKKTWFFDIWKLGSVPAEKRVIRCEFQLRREKLKEIGCFSWADLLFLLGNVWAYCTKQWLRFVENPANHHTHQKILPFWRVMQEGFMGFQGCEPAVRRTSATSSMENALRRLVSDLVLVKAIQLQGVSIEPDEVLDLPSVAVEATRLAQAQG